MRKIEIFQGKEITEAKINKIKQILFSRMSSYKFYKSSWQSIETVEEMAADDEIKLEDEYLILGKDWFLCYTFDNNYFYFLEWGAIDNKSEKFIQSIEMLNNLKKLILEHRNKQFIADMRHNTSFQFYSKMKDNGYFKEIAHTIYSEPCNFVTKMKLKYLEERYGSLEKLLDNDNISKYSKCLSDIWHYIIFETTSVFAKTASKENKSYKK